ncbi:hypothetical protein P9112_008761 [Eukaryota sp. TZLM1-RC]
MRKCSVCASSSSYKCPACRSPYCSLSCYKLHKDKCSGEVQSSQKPMDSPSSFVFATLSEKQRALLDKSSKISELCNNKLFMDVATDIVTSSNPLKTLETVIRNDEEFACIYTYIVELIGQVAEGYKDLEPPEDQDSTTDIEGSLIGY